MTFRNSASKRLRRVWDSSICGVVVMVSIMLAVTAGLTYAGLLLGQFYNATLLIR